MEIGSVSPDEVPKRHRTSEGSVWGDLAHQIIEAHKAGRVLTAKVPSVAEAKRLSNGVAAHLNADGFGRRFSKEPHSDGSITIYCQVYEFDDEAPVSVVQHPLRKPKRRHA